MRAAIQAPLGRDNATDTTSLHEALPSALLVGSWELRGVEVGHWKLAVARRHPIYLAMLTSDAVVVKHRETARLAAGAAKPGAALASGGPA